MSNALELAFSQKGYSNFCQCSCGKSHFDSTCDTLIDVEVFISKAKANVDNYKNRQGPFKIMDFGRTQIVVGCDCNDASVIESFFLKNRQKIEIYFKISDTENMLTKGDKDA